MQCLINGELMYIDTSNSNPVVVSLTTDVNKFFNQKWFDEDLNGLTIYVFRNITCTKPV